MEILMNLGKAFLVGGLICVVGQLLIDYTKMTPARILVLFVVLGVVLTAIGVYEPIVKWGGAGATVPLTGFGYNLAKGVQKAVTEKGFIGVLTGGLSAASGGIATVIFCGVVASLIGKPKEKK